MRCPRCPQDNPAGARFCSACGAGLIATCPACGHPNAPGSRFCNECGRALSPAPAPVAPERFGSPDAYTPRHLAERILANRDAIEGERKLVTVLFADVKASMELLADRDPEDARKLLDPVLERMMEAVHRYEGTVNQVLGDGIMALFGAPLAHEDHAVRACYAALRMQERVGRYGDEIQRSQGVPLQIRVGLNSGEVVVRAIGSDLRMDYTALGQTTHLAARMEQMSKPGSVLLTAETLRLAEGYVQVKPLGPVPVRGLAAPVEVFELAGTLGRTRLQVAAARGLTWFVGRTAELAHLRQATERARAGRGQVVAIVGEAGVGKSRLVWELRHSHRTDGWLFLESSGVSYGKASSYLPIVELLKSYLRIEEPDDPRRMREKLTGKLLALDEALRPTLPALSALLELPVEDAGWQALEPPARRRATLDAVKRLLLRESQVQPLLLVLEDLHWVDVDSQALLDALVEGLPTARLVLVVNYRPEYQHGWGSKSYYSQLRLDPLPPETAEGLLQALIGDDAGLGPLKQRLVESTQGNPFFLEESVRTLVETEALVGEPGAYRLAKPLQTVQVPATVHAILAARIDRLPPDDKRLLQAASVVGPDVPLALLQAIGGLPDEAVLDGLGRLQAGEFLYETRLSPDAEYTFKHALTLEVAYRSLLHDRRRDLHARVVDAIERLYAERLAEQAARLAHHAFRGEVWGKALVYLRHTVMETARSSLDAVLGGPESPGTLWWTGEHERAVTVGQRDLAIAGSFKNFGGAVVANCRLGQAHHALGDYARAAESLRWGVTSLPGDLVREQFGMAGLPSVFTRAWLAWCLAERGEFSEGIDRGEEGVEIAEAADHPYSRVLAEFGLGTLYVLKGELQQAVLRLERGLVVARVAAIPLLFPFVGGPLGLAYGLCGRFAEGLPLLEQALQQAASMNLVANQSLRLTWLAEAHLLADGVERGSELASQAAALAAQYGERGNQAYARRLLGEVASLRQPSEPEPGATAYRAALAQARELGMRPLAARCRLGLAVLLGRAGDRDGGRIELDAALEGFRALGMPFWLARAEAAAGELGL